MTFVLPPGYRAEPDGTHPAYDFEGYRSTALRHRNSGCTCCRSG